MGALLGLERALAELHATDSLLAPLDTLIRENPREPIYRAVGFRELTRYLWFVCLDTAVRGKR